MRKLWILPFWVGLAAAQQTVAPAPEEDASSRGEDRSGYNIVDSFETGYRFVSAGGNYAQYQSDVNFEDGIRLLGSYFSMTSKDGHGRFFDQLVITTQGLGNDPYENATLRISKNGLYRYDMSWRRNDYVNPGLTTGGASSGHFLDTQYDMHDHDLTLFPESNLKFFLGFTASSQTGPALSSLQLFDSSGSIYPLFENVRRVRREYRAGNEFKLFGFRVNWMHGWEDFKEDSIYGLTGDGLPTLLTPGPALTSFQRNEPDHGSSPYWRVFLVRDNKLFSFNGRFTYTGGERDFVMDESAIGPNRFGVQQNQQIVALGDAKRPVSTGSFTVSWLPAPKLTVVNSTSLYNVRTEGDSAYVQFDDATQALNVLFYQFLGIRTISNETDVNYQVNRWLGLSGGYQYSDRLIRSTEEVTIAGSPSLLPYSQTNLQHTGTLGIRLRPYQGLSVNLSAETGVDSRPLTPVAGKNYHALNGRIRYKRKSLLLSANAQSSYKFTPVSLSAYSSESRTYSVNGSWTPTGWFGLDAGYSRLHLWSLGSIAYFAGSQLIQGDSSLYLSNIHSLNFGARFSIKKRADLYIGYSQVQDVGDGRSTPDGAGIASVSPMFQAAQTFPMAFDSPLARLSIRMNRRVSWNIGYQYYGYREKFYPDQDYRVNTLYSSLTWSF